MLSSHVECKGTQEKALRTLSSSRSLAHWPAIRSKILAIRIARNCKKRVGHRGADEKYREQTAYYWRRPERGCSSITGTSSSRSGSGGSSSSKGSGSSSGSSSVCCAGIA